LIIGFKDVDAKIKKNVATNEDSQI